MSWWGVPINHFHRAPHLWCPCRDSFLPTLSLPEQAAWCLLLHGCLATLEENRVRIFTVKALRLLLFRRRSSELGSVLLLTTGRQQPDGLP